jgi:ABC transporter substrate binding protein (PQQ-dependent alcohol dehydrogenase system)
MNGRPYDSERRRVLKMIAGLALGVVAASAGAQEPAAPRERVRIAALFPSRTGAGTVRTSINDYVGDGGRFGTVLADLRFGQSLRGSLDNWHILLANTPTTVAAERSIRRMLATDDLTAIIGGVGSGQAAILAAAASEAGIPFLNVGDPDDSLRSGTCLPTTYHVEASAAMYLDALIGFLADRGTRSWSVVAEDSDWGRPLAARAQVAIARHGRGGNLVHEAFVRAEQSSYGRELNGLRASGADMVLMILNAADQIAFCGQMENFAITTPTCNFPDPVTQTRDYAASAQYLTPTTSPFFRVALWDAAVENGPEAEFNAGFVARWGIPADPTAWSAFHAVRMIADAVATSGDAAPTAVLQALDSAGDFDVGKGPGTSFRTWDRQLRQPLQIVAIDRNRTWDPLSLRSRIEYLDPIVSWPPASATLERRAQLDLIGDGPDVSCSS